MYYITFYNRCQYSCINFEIRFQRKIESKFIQFQQHRFTYLFFVYCGANFKKRMHKEKRNIDISSMLHFSWFSHLSIGIFSWI